MLRSHISLTFISVLINHVDPSPEALQAHLLSILKHQSGAISYLEESLGVEENYLIFYVITSSPLKGTTMHVNGIGNPISTDDFSGQLKYTFKYDQNSRLLLREKVEYSANKCVYTHVSDNATR